MNILFIGSESYDAATVTLIEGLVLLGHRIYAFKKNINSWGFERIVDDPSSVDFVLSNLHWGTRWSWYDKFDLHDHKCVLVDGDDAHYKGWRNKHAAYMKRYKVNPPDRVKRMQWMPYRWMEPLGDYEPDIVFCSQNPQPGEYYLPFGITEFYTLTAGSFLNHDRDIDFLHVPGTGKHRRSARNAIGRIPGNAVSRNFYGEDNYPQHITHREARNVHSLSRYNFNLEYVDALTRSNFLIYPSADHGFETKRVYEAIACGCIPICRRFKNRSFIDKFMDFVHWYEDVDHLVEMCNRLYGLTREEMIVEREMLMKRSEKVKSINIARYFMEIVC